MDNVLGELFGNIADAIRNKTGGTDAIKPSNFAEQINGIHTGSGEGLSLNYNTKSFTATDDVTTTSHGLGEVPDIIVIWPNEPPEADYITVALGFSKALMQCIVDYDTKYPGKVGYALTQPTGLAVIVMGTDNGFDEDTAGTDHELYGHIRDVTSTSFTVGSATSGYPKLKSGERYTFVAITGFFS